MNVTVTIALLGWLAAGPLLCVLLGARRGVLAALMLGWMFLPIGGFAIPGMPDYTKVTATAASALLGLLVFDLRRIRLGPPSWLDLPVLVWCLVPFASSLANGLGISFAVGQTLDQIALWGVPYIVGRLYFRDSESLRELAIAIVVCGLIYLPLCLYEIRMSPQLHRMVYGYFQHDFIQHRRYGGWRPAVFMHHGLMVALFMASATVVAAWLWLSGTLRRLSGVPMSVIAVSLAVTTVLCKSAGAIGLMFAGVSVLIGSRFVRTRVMVLILLSIAPVYMGLRATALWNGRSLVTAARFVAPERADSLQTRLNSEHLLIEHALQRPILGWGGWGRHRVKNERGFDNARTDGLWVIALGKYGLVGVASLCGAVLLPVLAYFLKAPRQNLFGRVCAPATALAIVAVLFMLDSLLNAMPNPMFLLAAGGLAGACAPQRLPMVRVQPKLSLTRSPA